MFNGIIKSNLLLMGTILPITFLALFRPRLDFSDNKRQLVSNPDFFAYYQQDKLLASWLLSMTSSDFLSYFIGTDTARKV